jgi:outer membrane protein assembly factor BamB
LALATGNIGQVSIAQSCSVVLRPGDSIQNAINNVSPNSVICLSGDTWQENLTITKDNLTLRGQGPSRTFIIGSVLVQVAGRFTVENLTLVAQAQFGLANAPWPMLQHDPQHTGRSPYVGPARPTLKWRYERDSTLYYPAIGADGTIYVGSDRGYLYAISPDGKEKWRFDAGYSIRSSPAIGADGTIYVGAAYRSDGSDGYLYAISPDGKEKWRFRTIYWIESSPAIGADGTIYVGSKDHYLYAISPDGKEKWRFKTGDYIDFSPAIGADGTIYVASEDNKLYAISPDGREKWRFGPGPYLFISSSPAIGADGTIYVGTSAWHGSYLYAISPDGKEKWRFDAGYSIRSSPAIGADGTIYVGSDRGYLYAISPDGKEKWRFRIARQYMFSSLAIGADGTIYVGSDDYMRSDTFYLSAISPDGREKWRFGPEFRETMSAYPVIGTDGIIYYVVAGLKEGREKSFLYAIGK